MSHRRSPEKKAPEFRELSRDENLSLLQPSASQNGLQTDVDDAGILNPHVVASVSVGTALQSKGHGGKPVYRSKSFGGPTAEPHRYLVEVNPNEIKKDPNLDEDVEKLFRSPVTFNVENLIANESTSDFKFKFGDSDYAEHRRDNMHMHHPLHGMASHKVHKARHDKKYAKPSKKARLKRKKKKHRLKTDTSLPSKPPVHPSIQELTESPSSGSDSADDYYDQNPSADASDDGDESTLREEDLARGVATATIAVDEDTIGAMMSDVVDNVTPKLTQRARAGFFIGDRRASEDAMSSDGCEAIVLTKMDTLRSPNAHVTTDNGENKPEFLLGSMSEPNFESRVTKPVVDAKAVESHPKLKSDHRHHKEHFNKADLMLRCRKGSEIHLDTMMKRVPTEKDEASMLHTADLDDMTSHRFEDVRGIRRHKIQPKRNIASKANQLWQRKSQKKQYDHTRHELFVEMDELRTIETGEQEWHETARWIKFEEDFEEGADRWGKAHVASLSFHSLIDLRKGLEKGPILLDLEVDDVVQLMTLIVDKMAQDDCIGEEQKKDMIDLLLLRHNPSERDHLPDSSTTTCLNFLKHANQKKAMAPMKRNDSCMNLEALDSKSMPSQPSIATIATNEPGKLTINDNNGRRNTTTSDKPYHIHIGTTEETTAKAGMSGLLKIIPKGAEATHVFVGNTNLLTEPVLVFVRLAQGMTMGNISELPTIPIRFMVFVLSPEVCELESHEVGRSMATLMSNQVCELESHEVGRSMATLMSNQTFNCVAYAAETRQQILAGINAFLDISIVLPPGDWDKANLLPIMDMTFNCVAYAAETRQQILAGINAFLDISIVLPPGDWDKANLLPIMDMARKRQRKRQKKSTGALDAKKPPDPLQRTKRPFGGLINDIRRRYKHYKSDFTDALNFQCVAAFIFIFFACLSPTIAFGGLIGEKTNGLMGVTETIIITCISGIVYSLFSAQPLVILLSFSGEKTNGLMGVTETIIITCISGIVYSLFSAQPLVILGYTGPVLLFEEMVYIFCQSSGINFLSLRVWIGVWIFVICTIIVAVEASFLVRYVTRFTEEIFVLLISLIFVYEVINKLKKIFHDHPFLSDYCFDDYIQDNTNYTSNNTIPPPLNLTYNTTANPLETDFVTEFLINSTDTVRRIAGASTSVDRTKMQPNTALFSLILCLGTFLIAYFLKVFRNSVFFGRSIRRMVGDFGVPIAIFIMVTIDYFVKDTFTEKLNVPDGLHPTSPNRTSWFIKPTDGVLVWHMFAAILPAFLCFILMFMETQITQVILTKKELKTKKGPGFHLDIFLIGAFAMVGSFVGLPFLCAASVRSVTHISALTVMAKQAPGEKPQASGVLEQRVTSLLVYTFIGISLLLGPVLRIIPMPVLFGVFLYMGISSMNGVQMFDRIKLLFMMGKHHPNIGYVRFVQTYRMNIYTGLQMFFLGLLWAVKSTVISLAFPFVLMVLVPIRMKLLPMYFSKTDLNHLDKTDADADDEDAEDQDFYQIAHMPF